MKDYGELVRRSIRKDFARANFKKAGRAPFVPHPVNTKRVVSVNERCEYYRFRTFFVGRLVRLLEQSSTGVWVEFVRDDERVKLNAAAGWSDNKKRYLLQGAKFDD